MTAWQVYRSMREHERRLQHTGGMVARRTSLVLMYDVMSDWYSLVQLRFRQVFQDISLVYCPHCPS